MTTSEWLASLKVGDLVAVSGSYGRRHTLGRVTALHKLHIVVGDKKYRRDSGYQAGERGYGVSHLAEPTEHVLRTIRVAEARSLVDYETRYLSDDEAIEVADLVRSLKSKRRVATKPAAKASP